uniref:Chemosensory protein n=1 Tax=Blattella germanica TaxID=6973 RepID=A0A0X8DBR6_BLAGE|nr:chemosensory protein [Blattella germanica]
MNSKLLFAILSAFVAIHVASAFGNVDVFLFSPLAGEDVESPAFLSRVTRGAGKGNLFKNCCGQRDMPAFTQEDIETKKACKDEASGNADRKEGFICAMDCMAKKSGIVDSDGNVDAAKFSEKVQTFYDEQELKDKVKDIVPEIVSKANAQKGDGACSKAAMIALFKTKAKIELECSESLKKSGEECDKVREWSKKFDSQ